MIRINMPTMLPCVPKEAGAVRLVRSLSAFFFFFFLFFKQLTNTIRHSNVQIFASSNQKNKQTIIIITKNMETDFAIHLVSESFKGKTAIARHRMVNALLKPEFDEQGLHALSLRLKTPEEWEKEGGGEMR